MRRFCAGIVFAIFTLSLVAPAIGADQVKGTAAAPQGQAAQTATNSNSAVVDKGLTTATITVPPSAEAQQYQIDLKPLMDTIVSSVNIVVSGIILALGGIITAWLRSQFNIKVDERLSSQFQTAATNAAGLLIAKGAVSLENGPLGKVTVHNEVIANAANDLIARFPDAIKHFDITPQRVQDVILGKLPQILNTSVTPVAEPATVKTSGL